MEYSRIGSAENVKIQLDSVAVVQRRTAAPGVRQGGDPSAGSADGSGVLSYFIYVGSSDGCITQYACSVTTGPTSSSFSSSAAAAPTVTATLAQKRRVFEGSDGSVPVIAVDEAFREPRLIVLSDGRVTMLHGHSLDPQFCLQGAKNLDGATACCVAQGPQEAHRLAAVVKKQLVAVEYTETQCFPYPNSAGHGTSGLAALLGVGDKAKERPDAGAAGGGSGDGTGGGLSTSGSVVAVPDGVSQMAWVGQVIIVGSKREYMLFDARTMRLVDHVVVEKMSLGPSIRFLPHYNGGHLAIRHGDLGMIFYDPFTKSPQPVDPSNRPPFTEPVADIGHCGAFLIGLRSNGSVLLISTVDLKPVNSQITLGTICRQHATGGTMLFTSITNQALSCMVPRSPDQLVADFVAMGDYERALLHFEESFRPLLESGSPTDEARYFDALQRARHACAVHAFTKSNRYVEAFQLFELAETPPESIVGAVPELLRPGAASRSERSGPMTVPTKRDPIVSADAWELLYSYLRKHRVSVVSPSASDAGGILDVSESQRDVDYAIFLLLLTHRVPFSEDALNELFLPYSTLEPSICLPQVELQFSGSAADALLSPLDATDADSGSEGAPLPNHGPSKASFVSLLLAVDGRFEEALSQCRSRLLVVEAIVPLQLSGDSDLYTEHLPWMLECNPSIAIRALTHVSSGGRLQPSVDAMLPLVLPYTGATLMSYLAHVIHSYRNRDPSIHTLHAINLIETIIELRKYGVAPLASSSGGAASGAGVPPGREVGLLGEIRSKLLMFLSSSPFYDADAVTSCLLRVDGLDHELVAAYRCSGEHDLALQILVYKINDYDAAIHYCQDVQSGALTSNWLSKSHSGREFDAHPPPMPRVSPIGNASFGAAGGSVTDVRVPSLQRVAGSSGSFFSGSGVGVPSANSSFSSPPYQMPRALVPKAAPPALSSYTDASGAPLILQRGTSPGASAAGGMSPSSNTYHHNTASSDDTLTDPFNEYYIILLRVLLMPPKGTQPKVSLALNLLTVHSHEINPVAVMETLPGDVAFAEISDYLVTTLHAMSQKAFTMAIAAQARKSELHCASRERALLTQRCVYVDDERPCAVCKKRVGDAVFGVFPNLKVAHFRCFKDRDVDPERGTPFLSDL